MRVLVPFTGSGSAAPSPESFRGAVEDQGLHDFYADGWLAGGLRVNFVASVDGSAHADGRSAGLQTPGDNRVFAALRDLADVVLVGAGTAVAEGYGPVRFGDRRVAVRTRYGFRTGLPVALVSRSLRLDPAAELFIGAAEEYRTIVLTCAAAPAQQRRLLAAVAEVVECGEDTVAPALARAALEERGLTRILSEGGPSVFGEQAAAGVVDELCLTTSPLMVGPGPARITGGAAWAGPRPLALTGLLEEDGALFARYAVG